MKTAVLLAALLPAVMHAQDKGIHLIPQPQQMEITTGTFRIDSATGLEGNAPFAMAYLRDILEKNAGIRMKEGADAAKHIRIHILPDKGIVKEGYSLVINPEDITIEAGDAAGAFYGVQTLLQMLPPAIYGNAQGWEKWEVPCAEIRDWPRFGYRGTHLDVSRTFFPIEDIYRLIDWLAFHKINTFHWHLTDDNGWRIEIRKYPLLTRKGAWRGPDEVLPAAYGSGNRRYGGYYTQEEIKAVIRYAADRNIEIIPELDMPGHSKAVVGSYPKTGCENKGHFLSANGEVQNVWCVGKEENYRMLDNIIKEVAALFPSPTIHIGGDEVNMDNWKNCPHCQALMKKQGMKEETELLNYFVRRMERIISKYGKNMAGWDEILDGGALMDNTAVYAWRSVKKGIRAVEQGQPTVFMVGEYCYFDMKQSPLERGHNWAGIVPLEKTYSLDPLEAIQVTPEEQKHILGVQGALWTELMNRPPRFMEYQFFPRTCAIAEVGWTEKEHKDYTDFFNRLVKTHYERMFNMGIAFRLPYPQVVYEDSRLKVKLPYAGAVVRYTTDGSEPDAASDIYTGDIVTCEPENFRFATFYKDTYKSITVGASNVQLHRYITPEVEITSSYKAEEMHRRFPMENAAGYDFTRHWRILRRSKAGDYVQYTFKKPVECSRITVETGIPNITFYSVTYGHLEYSYDGVDFLKGEQLEEGSAVLLPQKAVKAVRICVDDTSDALCTCYQSLRIEE